MSAFIKGWRLNQTIMAAQDAVQDAELALGQDPAQVHKQAPDPVLVPDLAADTPVPAVHHDGGDAHSRPTSNPRSPVTLYIS